jgi:tetratricopeptide (TPR) repeat protein
MTLTQTGPALGLPAAPPLAAPLEAVSLNRRGLERFVSGDVGGALDDFQLAGMLQPDYAEAWNNSGLVKQMFGRHREALADFDRALEARPEYPEALTNHARARQALGDHAGALAGYDRALACAQGRFAASVLHNRGTLKHDLGDRAGALADFDRALEIDPDHISTYVNRGVARKEASDLDGALADFDRALEKLPYERSGPVLHKRGGVRVLQNEFRAAIADYDQALALEPDNYLYYISRGNARYHRCEVRGLIDYRMAFRICAEGAVQELVRIVVQDVRRDATSVLDNCDKHLQRSDRDPIAHARRGLTLVLLGREAEAAANLARFQELVPDAGPYVPRLLAQARHCRERLDFGEPGASATGGT